MYRFLLFSYAEYYPCGGTDDIEFKFNHFYELVKKKDDLYLSDYIEIYDIKYDKTLHIKNKEMILREFKDYLE